MPATRSPRSQRPSYAGSHWAGGKKAFHPTGAASRFPELAGAEDRGIVNGHLLANSARFAAASSRTFSFPTFGYLRSSASNASMTAAATTTRVNHLVSAGTTYLG